VLLPDKASRASAGAIAASPSARAARGGATVKRSHRPGGLMLNDAKSRRERLRFETLNAFAET
jgi:hypothetical protein